MFAGGGAENLDDFDELINPRLSGKEWLAKQELRKNATGGPDVNAGAVIGGTEDQLGCPVITGADVCYIGFIGDQLFGASPITEFQHIGGRVDQQVLRFDVAMADAERVDVAEGTQQLVDVELDAEDGDGHLPFGIGP